MSYNWDITIVNKFIRWSHPHKLGELTLIAMVNVSSYEQWRSHPSMEEFPS